MVTLDRGMGLLQATATNIIGMVGVGPFLTIPFMVTAMDGPHILYAWAFGAVLALCDGLVYAELGAALPGSGGPYVYLREAYRPFGLGRLMAFVFIFQLMLVAPLSIAGGAVGFADYLGFYWTTMAPLQHNLVAAASASAVTALLYRDIRSIGRLAVVMLVVVLATVGWVIVAGLFSFSWRRRSTFRRRRAASTPDLVRAMARRRAPRDVQLRRLQQRLQHRRGDPRRPSGRCRGRSCCRSSIVVVLYVVMSTVILGMIPWQEAQQTRTIASLFIARTFADPAAGRIAAIVMTALILFVTASSLYAVILGYSRIPFAAARDGQFFSVFGRLHPTKHFPHVSLLTIGAVTLPFCFFTLGQLVNWLIQVQILLQFVWQCAGGDPASALSSRRRQAVQDVAVPAAGARLAGDVDLHLRVGAGRRDRVLGRVPRARCRCLRDLRSRDCSYVPVVIVTSFDPGITRIVTARDHRTPWLPAATRTGVSDARIDENEANRRSGFAISPSDSRLAPAGRPTSPGRPAGTTSVECLAPWHPLLLVDFLFRDPVCLRKRVSWLIVASATVAHPRRDDADAVDAGALGRVDRADDRLVAQRAARLTTNRVLS